jgi:hypothetical protein
MNGYNFLDLNIKTCPIWTRINNIDDINNNQYNEKADFVSVENEVCTMTQTKNGDHMKWGFKVNFCLNLIDCGVK